MSDAASRYCIRGGAIPIIYPGTLNGLNHAIQDGLSASRFRPAVIFRLYADYSGERRIIRTFKDGSCLWEPEKENS